MSKSPAVIKEARQLNNNPGFIINIGGLNAVYFQPPPNAR